ncbi:fungal-specific transcription factor domain-containing protein [Mycena albidolilacea]|uniref:Fungal-specific transcription factor domain-containing protein n=1 Tax=Mycena albidolilacea TaxID=1033008 RepID=A0AAD7AHH1_9AGAR|nr:fungal-specific transcription factor domain-containing protein [Mycena albidolilacea]
MSAASSDGLDIITETTNEKRRACDRCRRLKRRCDRGEICDQCSLHNLPCTYQTLPVIRTVADIQEVSYTREYVENLELRLKNAVDALRQPGQHLASGILKGLIKPLPPPHPADSGPQGIAASFEALFLDDPPPDPGFQGESSVAMLVKTAVAMKSGRPSIRDRKTPAPDPWNLKPWDTQRCTETQHLTFPQEHLLSSLISLYFVNVNIFIPVLHRPSFEDELARRLHLRQDDFASTLLLVCALGSLYLPEHGVSDGDRSKLAWSWYDQVELCGHSLRRQPTTYDLQAYCLAAHFLACASNPRASWSIVGFGLRLAQDIGALRRNVIAPTISTDEELEKRATWILMLLDAHLATALGRMTTLNPFDLDISLPSEYDDEWWNSEPEYKPQHPPSTIAFFNCIIGLYRILHFMLKNLYSTSRLYTANGSQDLQMLAAELDVTLNKWFSAIPQHLIWDPERLLDGIFFDQSAALHCFYDYIRMLLHRPFILGMSRTGQPNPRAQRICIKAACACISVANTHRLRRPDVPLFLSQNPLFTAAMVLILDMWAHPQHADERAQNIASVHIALEIFRSQQKRWPSSDFFVTVLERLLALDPPVQQPDELSDAASSRGSSVPGQHAEPWIVLARAWLEGAVLDRDSAAPALAMPPVLAVDQEVAPTQYHRLRALPEL